MLSLSGCANVNRDRKTTWVCQFQNFSPKLILKTTFDIVSVDYSYDGSADKVLNQKDVEKMKEGAKIVLAYINVGYAEDWRFYWDDIKNATFVGNADSRWKDEYKILDFSNLTWEKVIHEYVNKIKSQGFDGVYLDGVDAYESFPDAALHALEMIDLIKKIREWIGDGKISILNGYNLVDYDPSIANVVNFVSVESLFYKKTAKRKSSYYGPIIKKLGDFMLSGAKILSLDYVDDGSGYNVGGENIKRIVDYIRLSRQNGFIPYAARKNMKLNVLNVIPIVQGE